MSVSLFSLLASDGMRGNGHKMDQGSCRWDIRRKLFTERVTKHCNRLPRELVESPSLEAFKGCAGMVLSDMV